MPQTSVKSYRRRVVGQSIIIDWLSTSIAWLAFDAVRFMLLNVGFHTMVAFMLTPKVIASQLLFPTAMLGVYWLTGYYNDPLRRSRLRELLLTIVSALTGTMAVLLAMLLDDLTPRLDVDYLLLSTLFALLLIVVYIPRSLLSRRVIKRFDSGEVAYRAVMVAPEGVIAPDVKIHHVKIEGQMTPEEAAAYQETDCFILAPAPSGRLEDLMASAAILMSREKPVYIMASAGNIVERRYGQGTPAGGRNRAMFPGREPLIDISQTGMAPSTLNLKRVADITLSTLALLMTGPAILILAGAVKATSPGPAFYRQKRVGLHRRPFDIIKLRTMRADAEPAGPCLAMDDDPRVTPLGRVMRKYRLDELPQFINVIRGEMSIVGPRPERPHFVDQITAKAPFYTLLHQVRPGITSWGMVSYGYASSVDQMIERMRYDLLYIENAGFLLDLKIILHTIRTIATGKGL
ncbi:MAG: sugar transferase [Pseudoflavonifractor sp.]|nr:sugar transferase [Alloprevotella sp.]MCM1117602.1 sugar transferase [Pseudoflavonifractor sp.]